MNISITAITYAKGFFGETEMIRSEKAFNSVDDFLVSLKKCLTYTAKDEYNAKRIEALHVNFNDTNEYYVVECNFINIQNGTFNVTHRYNSGWTSDAAVTMSKQALIKMLVNLVKASCAA